MTLKATASVFLLPIVIVLLTSCGPTEGDRQRREIARQDSLARIRADSIAMAFNQNIDSATDFRSLMDQTQKPPAAEPDPVVEEPVEEKPAAAAQEPAREPAAQPASPQTPAADERPAQPQQPAAEPRPAVTQQPALQPSSTAQPRRTDTAVPTVNAADELAPSVTGGRYTVQLGTWRNEDLAKAELDQLQEWGITNTRLIRMQVSGESELFYVIRMGRYEAFTTARQQANYLNMEFGRNAVVIDLNPSM
jgi:cell division septation protein DedD